MPISEGRSLGKEGMPGSEGNALGMTGILGMPGRGGNMAFVPLSVGI